MTESAARDLAKRGGRTSTRSASGASARGFKAVPLEAPRRGHAAAALVPQDRRERDREAGG